MTVTRIRQARALEDAETRSFPIFTAGEVEVPYAIAGMGELAAQNTMWDPHAHPTHELLWNVRGASTVTLGARTWTITQRYGVWVPAGVIHVRWAPAGTWYRTAHFSVSAAPISATAPVTVEITPLLSHPTDRLDEPGPPSASREIAEAMVLVVLRPTAGSLLVHAPGTSCCSH